MTTNVSFEYSQAEKEFHLAITDEQKLLALQKMISYMPHHKGGESLRADLKLRLKKLKEKLVEKKKRGKGKKGISKEDLQATLIGLTNSGKSSILANLTNAKPKISSSLYTTLLPLVGTMFHQGLYIQIVDLPAINHESFDQSIANTTDLLLILITNPKELEKIWPFLENSTKNRLIILNKSDLLSAEEKRKFQAYLQSKKYNFIIYSALTRENESALKEKIISGFKICRVYTKSPGQKQVDDKPVLLPPDSTISDLARKIRIPPSSIKQARVSGPSSKFPNQAVGLNHVLKDKDIVEFKTE
ncbi:MAG: 50S ribosome-binding GTPase [Candidatus Pacearchaeota archaeon]|nr:50S ribosome-binding GTPase [Candidatus Pacearchaeota archaeon]